jgi:hypothetical protein
MTRSAAEFWRLSIAGRVEVTVDGVGMDERSKTGQRHAGGGG